MLSRNTTDRDSGANHGDRCIGPTLESLQHDALHSFDGKAGFTPHLVAGVEYDVRDLRCIGNADGPV